MQLERIVVAVFVLMSLYQIGQIIAKWIRKLPVPPDPWDPQLGGSPPAPPTALPDRPGSCQMRKLLRARDLSGIDVNLLKGLLEQAGIPCLIKNEYLSIALGDLPPAECYQELWLLDAADYPRAQAVFESWRTLTPLPVQDGAS